MNIYGMLGAASGSALYVNGVNAGTVLGVALVWLVVFLFRSLARGSNSTPEK